MELILTTNEELSRVVSRAISEALSIAMLAAKNDSKDFNEKWLNINELIEYLPDHPAKATIYSWVSKREIPYHKGGKSLRFLKSEIDLFLASGKRKSNSELEAEAEMYQTKKGGVKRYE